MPPRLVGEAKAIYPEGAAGEAQNLLTGVRGRHGWPVSRQLDVEIGADMLAERNSGDLPSQYAVSRRNYEQAVALFAPRTDTATGAWVSATYRPLPRWDVTATLRGDVFTSDGKAAIGPSPRVSMRVPLAPKIAFLAAMGVAPQPPTFAIPVPAIGYRGLPGGLGFAYQKSAGAELLLPLKFTLKAVGFHHSYFNLRDFAQDRGDVDLDRPQLEPFAQGMLRPRPLCIPKRFARPSLPLRLQVAWRCSMPKKRFVRAHRAAGPSLSGDFSSDRPWWRSCK